MSSDEDTNEISDRFKFPSERDEPVIKLDRQTFEDIKKIRKKFDFEENEGVVRWLVNIAITVLRIDSD